MASVNRFEEPPARTAVAKIQAIGFQANREDHMIARRTFIKGASALAATASVLSVQAGHAQQVPNSSGSAPASESPWSSASRTPSSV